MRLVSVKSSNIAQIGWEERYIVFSQPPTQILRIVFNSGFVYDYFDVPKEIYVRFLNASSIGKFFWNNIKDKYQYEKVN